MWNSLTVVGAEDLGIADREHLRAADGQSVEAGNARSALPAWIRIVQPVVVDEIVAGNCAESSVRVDPRPAFVVPHGFRKCRGGEQIRCRCSAAGMYCSRF